MDQKTLEIIHAGWAMFSRYGFAKTTMSDIANEAGVARQTVYNAFSSKEDILRAVMRHAGEQSLESVLNAWKDCATLEEKIAVFQSLGPISWFEAIQAAPDWGELMDGMNKASCDEVNALHEKWVSALEAMLLEHKPLLSDANEIAEFHYSASKNAKYGINSVDELKARLETILRATLALVEQ